jgi:predicted O-methyltransferase YrrM
MIDRWEVPGKEDSYAKSGSEISEKEQKEFDLAYHESVNVACRFRGRAHIVKMDSAVAARKYQDESIDLVFIDGDHSYDGCLRDIKAWLPKVKKGGWICGHDYNHPKQGNVKKAVDEMFKKVELGTDRTWFWRKPV